MYAPVAMPKNSASRHARGERDGRACVADADPAASGLAQWMASGYASAATAVVSAQPGERGEPAPAGRVERRDDAREHGAAHDRRRIDVDSAADPRREMGLHEAGQQRLHHRDPDTRAAGAREQQPRVLRADARHAGQPDQRDAEPHAARDAGHALQAPRTQRAEPHQQDRDRRQQAGRAVADAGRALDHVEQRADRGERRPQVQPDEHDGGKPPSGGSEAIHRKALEIGARPRKGAVRFSCKVSRHQDKRRFISTSR